MVRLKYHKMNFFYIMEKDIVYIIMAHGQSEGVKSVRRWDHKTPYSIHPIWCATMLLHETSLPEDLRQDGSLALLYHDILEDTPFPLPCWLSERVLGLVNEMTFRSFQDEIEMIWGRSKEARLLKLYDKTSNLLDGAWMEVEKMGKYTNHTSKLCEDVERNYGELNITKVVRAII